MDLFTQKRIVRFVEEFRKKSGKMPCLKDFEASGFDRERVELAVKDKVLEQFYVTLTSGTVVKTFKIRVSG